MPIITDNNNLVIEVEKKISIVVDGGRGPSGNNGEANVNADWDAVSGDALILNKPTKTSQFINDGESGSPFITHEDLPSNITLFATNANSDVSGYFKLVSSLEDVDYNDTAVDINTGAITTSNQLIASLVASAGLFVGNPGIINITTIGEIKRISGSGKAMFYFEVYKRNQAGVETLITTSNNTIEIDNSVYEQFSATALLNDGTFLITDRIVLKFYGTKVDGGSNPTYNFSFGGTNPVRTSLPVPLSVVPSSGKPWVKASDIEAIPLVTDEILHDGKVIINDVLKSVANYETPNQAVFNIWDHNTDNENLPLFLFSGGEFPNPNPLTQPNNYVYNFGINISSGGGNYDPTKASIAVGFETEFYIEDVPYSEWHVLASDSGNIKQRRPITIVTAHDGSYIGMSHHLSRWAIYDHNQTKEIFSLDVNNENWVYNGTNLRHIFNSENYQPIWQKDGSGTAYPLIGYLTGRLQLGNPSGNTLSRIGQSFEFGHNGVDFIGTALGDGATNLHLGISGKKYNTIFVNGNFELPLRLTTPSNSNGWGHGVTPSTYYFYDYNNSKSVLDLSSTRIQCNSAVNFGVEYPTDGSGVANGSLFRATTGALYYKGTSGTVTLIANS